MVAVAVLSVVIRLPPKSRWEENGNFSAPVQPRSSFSPPSSVRLLREMKRGTAVAVRAIIALAAAVAPIAEAERWGG